MRVVLLLAFAILASSPMSSQTEKMEASNKKSGASGKASAPSSAGFARLADQFMKESLALSPVSASQAGYHVHGQGKAARHLDAELDDLSPAGFDKQLK